MINNLTPKTGTPQLSSLGTFRSDLSQCTGCDQFVDLSLKGAFKANGKFWLEFVVNTKKTIALARINILDADRHIIKIDLLDDPSQLEAFAGYFVETDSNFAVSPDWSISFEVNRGGKRSVWKYTKGHGMGTKPKRRWWQLWFRKG